MTTGQLEVESAIEALHKDFVGHFNAGRAEELVDGFYTEDARLLPANAPMVTGRSNILAFVKEFLAMGGPQITLKNTHIDASGDLAYGVGNYTMNMGGTTDEGKWVEVYRRQADGSWKAVADMFSSDQAPPA